MARAIGLKSRNRGEFYFARSPIGIGRSEPMTGTVSNPSTEKNSP
jgi:hypothetical protein